MAKPSKLKRADYWLFLNLWAENIDDDSMQMTDTVQLADSTAAVAVEVLDNSLLDPSISAFQLTQCVRENINKKTNTDLLGREREEATRYYFIVCTEVASSFSGALLINKHVDRNTGEKKWAPN